MPLNISLDGREAFKQLKAAFVTVPILTYFDPIYPYRIETDVSSIAISSILS